MKTAELRKKTKEDLSTLLDEKKRRREELVPLLRGGKVKNTKELRGVKRDIARILTIISE
ncbi:MAG: 50S ribosomal protein L29 [Candidatus Sungbacteria bacterium]|nr:50S ribosomal protein L29 [Candidatus Sungbacteria bacterium]